MRSELFGVPLDLLTMEETIERAIALIETSSPAQHVVLNAGKVVMMQDVAGLRDIISECEIVNADGQSIVWAGRLLGVDVPERVAGIDLMMRLLAKAEERAWPVYLLGARDEVLAECRTRLETRYPRLIVAGQHNGYFDDDQAAAESVRMSGARLLFVGITSPRKEYFLSQQMERLGPVFAMGVGGSFDVIAGLVKRAPLWMQKSGLEWLYRLAQEPRRMWKRYLVGNARFGYLVVREYVRGRSSSSRHGFL